MNIVDTINEIEQRARDRIKAEQGDYILNGLLHCHKCNTPKQCRVVFFGEERTPPCLCKCEVERRNREKEEQERAEFERRVK